MNDLPNFEYNQTTPITPCEPISGQWKKTNSPMYAQTTLLESYAKDATKNMPITVPSPTNATLTNLKRDIPNHAKISPKSQKGDSIFVSQVEEIDQDPSDNNIPTKTMKVDHKNIHVLKSKVPIELKSNNNNNNNNISCYMIVKYGENSEYVVDNKHGSYIQNYSAVKMQWGPFYSYAEASEFRMNHIDIKDKSIKVEEILFTFVKQQQVVEKEERKHKRKSQQQIEIQQTIDMIFQSKDDDEKCIELNKRLCKLTGYTNTD